MDWHHGLLPKDSLRAVPRMHAEIGMDRVAPISKVTLLRFRIALTFLFLRRSLSWWCGAVVLRLTGSPPAGRDMVSCGQEAVIPGGEISALQY